MNTWTAYRSSVRTSPCRISLAVERSSAWIIHIAIVVIPKEESTMPCRHNSIRTNSISSTTQKDLIDRFFSSLFRFSLSLFRSYFENPWSSFKQDDHGVNISYNVREAPEISSTSTSLFQLPLGIVPNAVHSFTWEGVWRSVLAASPSTSLDVRKDAGHTLKSSLKVCSLLLS